MFISLLLFVLAGLAEIGGGYLVWIWLRDGKPFWLGAAGFITLCIYGVIPVFQAFPSFGRVYAAYGGIFIVLSILWGWLVDKAKPDFYDLLGAVICVIGASLILWAPRH
ncbi:YnfA family protein [Peribacillus kribbensis]|uniref:YnfA family protein n=1 Tax=Peribacillus kribbensis TaxID=356658 RepID=UPI0004155E68|nr:YnfA family protein [Peribacillus kribbensis]